MQGLSCFGAIIPNREVKFICLPCLVLLCFSFLCFACFLGVSRFLVGIILYLWSIFLSLLLGYYIISYHIIPISHHISGKHLLLCLSVLMSTRMLCIHLFAPFICLFSGFTLYFFFPCYLIVIFTEQNWWKTIFFMKMGYFYSILLV